MKKHVFISYSRKNYGFADDLVAHLQNVAKVPFWIDRHDVTHSDRSFEKKIRAALKESWGAILIATPDALDSEYVQGELDIIRERAIPLIVVWAEGDFFTDTVPTPLTRQSYIDCRAEAKQIGFDQLTSSIIQLWKQSVQSIIRLEKDKSIPHEAVAIHSSNRETLVCFPSRFPTIGDFLRELYLGFLTERFAPFTYGREWIITFDEIYPVVFIDSLQLINSDRSWQSQPLSNYGIPPAINIRVTEVKNNSVWKVVAGSTLKDFHEPSGQHIKTVLHIHHLINTVSTWRSDASVWTYGVKRNLNWADISGLPNIVWLDDRTDENEPLIEFIQIS